MAHLDDPQTQKANMDYIRESMNAPLLDKEHELALAHAWRDNDDEKSMHEIINAYRRLVVSAAGKFRHYGLPYGDLIQEGNIGLLEAAKRFDPAREFRFSTYATWWIRASLQDYVLRNWSIVRTGTTSAQKSLFFNLRRLKNKIAAVNDNDSTYLSEENRDDIAKALGVSTKAVEDMDMRLSSGDQSLNITVGIEGDTELQSLIADEAPNPEEIVMGMKDAQSRSKWLNDALSELNDREQRIIKERHLTYEPVTLDHLGQSLGISKERVRQIEAKAMHKLRDTISGNIHDLDDLFLER